jgi:uncharacterized membrane protein YeaQ/YmgE (transglycosylase-associated protein family)
VLSGGVNQQQTIWRGDYMSLILALIIGAIIGWLGAALVGRSEGILGSVAIGIVGAIIGSFLAEAFGSGTQGYFAFSWAGVIWTLIGAVIFSAILNSLQHHSTHSHI